MNDEALVIKKLISGDKYSFELIYNKYSKDLYYIALAYIGNKEAAEDIIQETFVYLWDNRQNILPQNSVFTYLKKIVRNSCLNYLRNLKVKKKHEELIKIDPLLSSVEKEEISELVSQVKLALDKLPEKCRKIFVLSCVEGLKYNEIAEDMDVSVNTVKSQMKIAYKKIRKGVRYNDVDFFVFYMLLEISYL